MALKSRLLIVMKFKLFGSYLTKSVPDPMSLRFSPIVYSKSFADLPLAFRLMILMVLASVNGEVYFVCLFLHVCIQF